MSDARGILLTKALAYYGENGVRDTSLRTLAAAIGTSQRMLHYHFGSREDLLVSVIEVMVDADNAMLLELFESEPDPFEAGRANWHLIVEHARMVGALFFELSSHAMYGLPHASRLNQTLVVRSEAAFAQAYVTLNADEEAARRLARLTVAVGRGLLFEALIDNDFQASEEAVEIFIAMIRREIGLHE